MSDNRRITKTIHGLERVKTWQLFILLILSLFIAATLLRLNNVGMVERRDAVLSADQQGDEEVIIQRLYDLQRYVAAHMNTNLGDGVLLEATYSRDMEIWQQKAYAGSSNGNIFVKAQQVCAPRFSSWSTAYVQCVSDELAKYPAAEAVSDSSKPRQENYIHNYASPLWTPDIAGWSVVVSLVIVVLILVRLAALGVLHILLRQHYRTI